MTLTKTVRLEEIPDDDPSRPRLAGFELRYHGRRLAAVAHPRLSTSRRRYFDGMGSGVDTCVGFRWRR